MRVVIVGGSFGGLTSAYELRKHLGPSMCEILLISKDRRFVFIPSLPWVVMGAKTLDRISFDLEKPLGRKNIKFAHARALLVDPKVQKVITDGEEYPYDYLIVATGPRSANETVPGLGPFDGPGHSLISPADAEEARQALEAFLESPGPMVIGCAPGASCIGPAYEFAFEIDYLLRKKKLRHKVPIAFVTPEPFLGHLGMGGVGKVRQFLEGEFEERDIRYYTSVAVSKVTESSVELANGKTFESRFSLVIPPFAGVKAVADSPGLGNPKGFIPVDEHYRHKEFSNIYAVGVAVAFPPVDETPVPVNFLKTGHMTEQMAVIAARNIAAEIKGGKKVSHPLFVECILDMGDTAARIKADPVRPPRNLTKLSEGKRWLWAKRVFERYYLWRAKRGKTMSSGWGW
ncbi:MAG: FAD-dependent oxidoreductase [Dehalococcoidia bacterium]|nr:FAD-dependent oxidoreductase [Dehalococcoidia bacterium]